MSSTAIAGTNGLYADANSWTGAVYLAIIGDSISAGGGACGRGVGVFPTAISNANGGRFSVTNGSAGGARWLTNTSAPNADDQLNAVLKSSPRFVLCTFGRNDLLSLFPSQAYPDYWVSTVSNCVYSAYTNCLAHNAILMLGEILPAYSNEFSIVSIHGFNSAYSNFCLSFPTNTYFKPQHDAFGWYNPSSGGYDILNTNYYNCTNYTDTLHINQYSYEVLWGPLVLSNLADYFTDPPPVPQAHIDRLTIQQLQFR